MSLEWSRRVLAALSSWRMARVGGLLLVVGGISGVFGAVVSLQVSLLSYTSSGPSGAGLSLQLFLLSLTTLAVAAGALGMWRPLSVGPARLRRPVVAGLLLVCGSGALFGLAALSLALRPPDYSAYFGPSPFERATFAASSLFSLAGPVGVLILGVCALFARSLGVFRWVLFVTGLLLTPLPDLIAQSLPEPERVYPYVDYSGGMPLQRGAVVRFAVFYAPDALAGLGWMVVGCTLFGARERAARLEAGARARMEEANLAAARTLYERAWGRGDLSALEAVVSPEVEDRYHGESGIESFRRNVASLRRSFPDLRFTVEGQWAEGDEVTTRWRLEGADEGGVLYYPPTGRRATLRGVFTDRFEGGDIVEHSGESETAELLKSLGLR